MNLTQFLQKYQDKIVLSICFILVFSIAFGMGRLSLKLEQVDQPVVVSSISISQHFATLERTSKDESEPVLRTETGETQGQFVGSRKSDKYHLPDCYWARRIKPDNRIWFKNEAEARARGYKPSSCVK